MSYPKWASHAQAAAAATASGLMSRHLAQLKTFLDECFA